MGAARLWSTLVAADVDMLAVYSLPQANALADAGCHAHVLVLMPVHRIEPDDAARPLFIDGRVHLTVHDVEQATALIQSIRESGLRMRVPVHIEVDTGMTRGGARPAEALELVQLIHGCRELAIAGVFSHLTAAVSASATDLQTAAFDAWTQRAAPWLPRGVLMHVSSSHAAIRDPGTHRDMIRVGLAWTGLVDDEWGALPADDALECVVQWSTTVVQVKRVPAGTPVGYGSTWHTPRDTVIALLPVGYADGYPSPRVGATNVVRIRVGGAWHCAPVVGAVNMDQLTVDAGAILGSCGSPQALVGAPVELLGVDRSQPTHPVAVATTAGKKPYEILCGLSARVPRVYAGAHQVDARWQWPAAGKSAAAHPRPTE